MGCLERQRRSRCWARSNVVLEFEVAASGRNCRKGPLASLPSRPFLIFTSLAPDDTFKRVVVAPLDAADGPQFVTPMIRKNYTRSSRGLSLEPVFVVETAQDRRCGDSAACRNRTAVWLTADRRND